MLRVCVCCVLYSSPGPELRRARGVCLVARVHYAILRQQTGVSRVAHPGLGCVVCGVGVWLFRRVTAVMAGRKHPVTFRTRKLSFSAPMVLHSGGCGRVGHRRTIVREGPHVVGPFLHFQGRALGGDTASASPGPRGRSRISVVSRLGLPGQAHGGPSSAGAGADVMESPAMIGDSANARAGPVRCAGFRAAPASE